ncbi:MAG: phosphotransferase [Verrucomicrobia bacterium]|nr:phosphotransferase [Verrucomicrobiota bacterium]MBS0636928.1 phosphotransferase [Verrucomicrobiota bacterium]
MLESITSCLHADYGIKVAALEPLSLGADVEAALYKAETADKKRYFIKVKTNSTSIAVTRLLQDAGLQNVILPIKNRHGEDFQKVENRSLVVYPFIEGEDGFSRPLRDEQWIALGKALRQVHEVAVPIELRNQIREEAYSNKWRKLVEQYLEIDSHPDAIASRLAQFMKKHKSAIRAVIDHANELADGLTPVPSEFVLCHSDIHGGNILIGKDDALYIVDWDEPIMAPKERDLMFIGGGVANVWNKPQEEEFFYKGYGPVEVNKRLLAYYRHERIVEDVAIYCRELFSASGTAGDREVMLQHFVAMFEPNGVVDIANKTYAQGC